MPLQPLIQVIKAEMRDPRNPLSKVFNVHIPHGTSSVTQLLLTFPTKIKQKEVAAAKAHLEDRLRLDPAWRGKLLSKTLQGISVEERHFPGTNAHTTALAILFKRENGVQQKH